MQPLSFALIHRLIRVAAIAALAASFVSGVEAQSDLQGAWVAERQEMNGQARVIPKGQIQLVFKGDRLIATGLLGSGTFDMAFSVDDKANPKILRYTAPPAPTTRAYFEVKDDVLTLGYPLPGSKDAPPTALSSTPGSGLMLLVLRRAK